MTNDLMRCTMNAASPAEKRHQGAVKIARAAVFVLLSIRVGEKNQGQTTFSIVLKRGLSPFIWVGMVGGAICIVVGVLKVK